MAGIEADDTNKRRLVQYDCVLNEWFEKKKMPNGLRDFTVSYYRNRLYVVGGYPIQHPKHDFVNMYDIATDKWIMWPMVHESHPLYTHRRDHSAAVDNVRGRLYITGGTRHHFPEGDISVDNMEEWHFNSEDGSPSIKAVHGMKPRERHSSHVFETSGTLMVMGGLDMPFDKNKLYYESAGDNSMSGITTTVDSWRPEEKEGGGTGCLKWRREYHLTPSLSYLTDIGDVRVKVLDGNRMYWVIYSRTRVTKMLSTYDPLTHRVEWESSE
jgi:hypothetical protein